MDEKEFIKIAKKDGIEAAFSMSARDENKGWRCPVCESPVEIGGQERFETLGEHVSDPNKVDHPLRDAYQCTNKECKCNNSTFDGRDDNVFWNYMGEMYGGFYIDETDFIGQNNAPFGSFERKTNVEIMKVGLKSKTYLHPAFCLWFLQPYIEHLYKSNTNGEVVKKSYRIQFLKKDERGEYSYGWTSCWSTWKYLWDSFSAQLKAYKEHKDPVILKSAFKTSYNQSWEYRWFETFTKVLYRKYYKLIS